MRTNVRYFYYHDFIIPLNNTLKVFGEVNQVQGQVSLTEVKNLFWYLECSRRTYKMVVARGQRKKEKPALSAHYRRVLVSECL